MNRIPIFDVEESESLTKNLSFVVGLDPETLFGIKPPPSRCSNVLRTVSIIVGGRSRSVCSTSNGFAEDPQASTMFTDYELSRKNVNDYRAYWCRAKIQ